MFAGLSQYGALTPIFHAASEVLGFDLYDLPKVSNDIDIFQNEVAQVLMCASAIATWSVLREDIPIPAVFAGYSIGELAAYCLAGSLRPSETFSLAKQRAVLMDRCLPGGMLAVRGLDRGQVGALCSRYQLEVAIINGPLHYVLGGDNDLLKDAVHEAEKLGAKTVRVLNVSVASHVSRMEPAATLFREALERSGLTKAAVPVLSCVSAKAAYDRASAIEGLSAQLSHTLQWYKCMRAASEMGVTVFLEMLPGSSLTRMVLSEVSGASSRACAEFKTIMGAAAWTHRQCTE